METPRQELLRSLHHLQDTKRSSIHAVSQLVLVWWSQDGPFVAWALTKHAVECSPAQLVPLLYVLDRVFKKLERPGPVRELSWERLQALIAEIMRVIWDRGMYNAHTSTKELLSCVKKTLSIWCADTTACQWFLRCMESYRDEKTTDEVICDVAKMCKENFGMDVYIPSTART